MEIHGIILLFVAILEILLGGYIFFRGPENPINRSYILLVLSVLLWVISNALIAFFSDERTVELLYRLSYIGGAFIALFFLYFAMYFPYKTFFVPKKLLCILALPPVALTLLLLTGRIVSGLNVAGVIYHAKLENWFFLYLIIFIGYFIWAFALLYRKYARSDGIHRWQLKFVLLSTIIPFAVSLVTDIFLPWIVQSPSVVTVFFGSESSIVWLGLTAYILFKKW